MVNQPLSAEKHLSKSMMIFVLWAGLFGIAVQFNDSVKNLAIWIGLVELFSLVITSRKYYDEREQQLLNQSFSLAFQWLAIALLIAFGFLQVSERLNVASNITSFINSHWIGLTVSIMALLLGLTGLRLFREDQRCSEITAILDLNTVTAITICRYSSLRFFRTIPMSSSCSPTVCVTRGWAGRETPF